MWLTIAKAAGGMLWSVVKGLAWLLGGWRALGISVLLAGAMWHADRLGDRLATANTTIATMTTAAETARADAEAAARAHEQQLAKAAAAASELYERGKIDAQAAADRVVSDLRAGSLRLRREWGQCETGRLSDAAARAAEPDGEADDRASRAGRIVRAAATCDAQVKGLQALVIADRQRMR